MRINQNEIELAMEDLIIEVKVALNINVAIDGDFCPGEFIMSDALMTVIGRLGSKLDIEVPLNCYPFFDKDNHKQLSIKEAAKKVYKLLKNGKN